jgi:predicted regulator of Ras-like GTPase activity (Roadblock/LC7/MglB family)
MTAVETTQRALEDLLTGFVARTPGVAHAIVASPAGLPVAASAGLPPQRAEQLAAVGAGMVSLAFGAAQQLGTGGVVQCVVEMVQGLLVSAWSTDAACLAVLATADCDRGLVGYEVAQLAYRVASIDGGSVVP